MKTLFRYATLSCLVCATGLAQADTGKLLLTGGVSSITGSAGGGLTPWAVIGTNATEGEIGVSSYLTRAVTQDYALNSYGVALGLKDRVELSLSRMASPATLTLRPSTSIWMCWPGCTPKAATPLRAMLGEASKSCRASESSTRSFKPRATP